MRLSAYQRFQYTALIYDFNIDPNDQNANKNYFPTDMKVYFEFMTDPNSPRLVIYSRSPLRKEMILVGISDRDGIPIMGNAQYVVRGIEPAVNILGQTEGYRMTLALAQESDYENLVDRTYNWNDPVGGGTGVS